MKYMLIIIGLCLSLAAGCGSSKREAELRRQNAELSESVNRWRLCTVGALAVGGILLFVGAGLGNAKGKDDE